MKKFLSLSLALGFMLVFSSLSTPAQDESDLQIAKSLSNTYASIASAVSPAVVSIETERKMVPDEQEMPQLPPNIPPQLKKFLEKQFKNRAPKRHMRPQGMGSGFFFDSKGIILTNNHVVEDAEKIKVNLKDGSSYEAELVGADPKSDLAVIKISKPEEKVFPVAKLGDSSKAQVGNIVLAIGAPFGLKQSVTSGIISAMNRQHLGGGQLKEVMYKNFIQTDATINPGNSGGPLVNLDGEVIGINSAISTASMGSDGVGFSIPINMAKEISAELIKEGAVTRGYLGVAINDFTAEMAEALVGIDGGVSVLQVYPGTPAYKGGMKFGDILLTFNGIKLEDSVHLQNLVARTPVGDTVKIEVLRNGEKVTLDVPIAKQPQKMGLAALEEAEEPEEEREVESYTSDLFGAEITDLAEAPKELKEIYTGLQGVIVESVVPGGALDRVGIPSGALLMLVNQQPIATIEAFKNMEEKLKDINVALLHFRVGKNPGLQLIQLKKK